LAKVLTCFRLQYRSSGASLARTGFAALLRPAEDKHRSLVIEKRGMPKAVLIRIRDHVRLAAPESEVLEAIGKEWQTYA